jgi:HK97 family phage prohead protease
LPLIGQLPLIELAVEPPAGSIWAAAPVGGVDESARTISGLVLPWNQSARVNGCEFPVRFVRGSVLVDGGVRLLGFHDRAKPLGAPTEWRDTPAGLRASFKVARTRAGDEALSMAADGILDGLSIGAELVEVDEVQGEIIARAALAREVSLVTIPAWASARVGAE